MGAAANDPDYGALRVAMVGCGPKGLYALDSLTALAERAAPARGLDVTIFEPADHPGAGAVYDLLQPYHLRMNFASRFIDAWDRTKRAGPGRRLTLVEWLRINEPDHADPHGFVPRAMVGRYLSDCFQLVLGHLPTNMRIVLRPERVIDIRPDDRGWRLDTAHGVSMVDEVLIATGHQDWKREHDGDEEAAGSRTIRCVFPVDRQLSIDRVPPGSVVGLKGFALTWIDASLALTEGRGGRFSSNEGGYDYRASGREPARLVPSSRTGRPLLAKPDMRVVKSPAPEDVWEDASDDILALGGRLGSLCFETQIWPKILGAADRALDAPPGAAEGWFEAWRARPFDGERALHAMRSSFRVAIGRAPPDRGWALGEAWRRTYRALVRVISHGGLKASSWQDFSRISREMERIACGPPAVNMGYMLALIDAGVMDLGHVSHDAGPSADARPGDVDIWIDATIPPPGQFDAAGPIGRLLDDGWLERGAGGGLVINQYGQALAGGRPVPGLSVLGRPTEGCVLGNDTLNRALHRHPFRWAERMIDRVAGVVDMQCRMLACS